MRFFSLCTSLLCCATLVDAAAGDWTVYPTVGSYWRIEALADSYYMLNGNTLVVADASDVNNARTMTRTDGLNGNTIADIAACPSRGKLAIVYSDGNIDIMLSDGAVHNLPDYANHTITGDRSIAGIGMSGDTLYVSTGFGGFCVDMADEVVRTTLYDAFEADAAALSRCRKVVAGHVNDEALAAIMNSMQEVNGAQVQQAAQMRFKHGRLYAAQSTFNNYVNYQWGTPVISILDTETGTWTNITADRLNPMVKARDNNALFHKITAIEPDPFDPERIYCSSLEGGIYRIDGDSLTGYWNAVLDSVGMTSLLSANDYQRTRTTRVGALYADEMGFLWFTNGDKETATTLRSIGPDGTFYKYPTPGFTNYNNGQYGIIGRLVQSTVNVNHIKWMVRTFHINSSAVCMYHDNGTPEKLADDVCSMFTTITDQDGNTYSPTYFHDIAEDKEGLMWLLTSIGPFVIDDQYDAITNPGTVRRIKIPRNDGTNLADYLLAEVSCRCIVVDASNRKWIGTDDAGLYLLSADGMTQLEHFTTDNSPLFSNRVAGLVMDDATGTLYIGTDGGICAYQTDVLKDVADNESVYCYPNPVRKDFTGELSILGFKNGSTVTISDMTHHVVFRQVSDGAIMRWDLRGNDGQRIRPGVYYIDAIEEGGKKGGSFKFLVF